MSPLDLVWLGLVLGVEAGSEPDISKLDQTRASARISAGHGNSDLTLGLGTCDQELGLQNGMRDRNSAAEPRIEQPELRNRANSQPELVIGQLVFPVGFMAGAGRWWPDRATTRAKWSPRRLVKYWSP